MSPLTNAVVLLQVEYFLICRERNQQETALPASLASAYPSAYRLLRHAVESERAQWKWSTRISGTFSSISLEN